MSSMQTIIMDLELVSGQENETLHETIHRIYKDIVVPNGYKDIIEYAMYEDVGKYRVFNDKVYECNEIVNSRDDYDDICLSFYYNNKIRVECRWYNGGASSSEIIEKALNKLNK